jgi:hypothetical protein
MKDLLNPSQRSSLRGVLTSVEKSLRLAQSWLDGAQEDGILYKANVQIPADRRRRISQEIAGALNEIRELSVTFDLEKREENPLALIRSELVISWANLLDSHSAKMGRYGAVSSDLAEKLDAAVLNLADTALHLSRVFEDLLMKGMDTHADD